MRIVFFGTNEFSATILKGLLDANRNVVAVVSQPDRINGRNNKIILSAVKKLAIEKNIPIYQFEKLNKEGEEILKSYTPDLFITASYGQIIKQNILDIPKYGTVNVHASLLPKYRGPAPIQWAIINGESKTGITIMKTDIGMDTGDIYFKKELEISAIDTATSVFDKLATLGVECINEFLDKFDYYKDRHFPQDNSQASYYPMIKKEDYLINFNTNAKSLCDKIRGLENCYFIYNGTRYKVQFASISELEGKPGEILACDGKNGLIIATADKAIEIIYIQPEGKQKMLALSYMNSNKFKQGDIIENS